MRRFGILALTAGVLMSACMDPAASDRTQAEQQQLQARMASLESQLAAIQAEQQAARTRIESLGEQLGPLQDALARYEVEPSESVMSAGDAPADQSSAPLKSSLSDCVVRNTGSYGFRNTYSDTTFTVTVFHLPGSDSSAQVIVPPGQTEYFHALGAGEHNFTVTYIGRVPFMSFPPGAPLIDKELLFSQAQILVEQCKSGLYTITRSR